MTAGSLGFQNAKLTIERETLNVGDRVQLSDRARLSFRGDLDRCGVVVSISHTNSAYKIRWDGKKTEEFVHWSYLKRDVAAS
jgi:hypothetical protein